MGEGRPRRGRVLRVLSAVSCQLSVFCVLFLLTSSVLSARTLCTIEVDVSDGRGRIVGEVDVRAEASVLIGARHLTTRADGTAVLLGLPPGSYRMEISRLGYQWLEVQDVRCEPGAVVRLNVTLEETDGDEVVVLPSGPSVDPESVTIGRILPRAALERLPRPAVPLSRPDGALLPLGAIAFEGLRIAGFSGTPGPELIVFTRSPEVNAGGRASFGVGAGLTADSTGSRGEVTSLEDFFRARLGLGGTSAGGDLRAFLALETHGGARDSRVVIDEAVPGEELRRRRQWDQQSIRAYGALGWSPSPGHRLDLGIKWGRERENGVASSLHVVPEDPLPGGDWELTGDAIDLAWRMLASDRVLLRVGGGYGGMATMWEPESSGAMQQDLTPEGMWSEGQGNGIWAGDGGVAAFDQAIDEFVGEAGLEWSAGSGNRLSLGVSWRREELDLEYPGRDNAAALGERRTSLGPVAARRDTLVPPEVSRGVEESTRVALSETWRAGPGLTVLVGLEGSVLDFEATGRDSGYRLGLEETLSPRVGLVWDFEGSGRSRAWVRWARFRQGPGEAVRLRMSGALDVETLLIDEDGNRSERLPGPMTVASDFEPADIDETVFGIEYELLSYLSAGVAGAVRRSWGHLGIMTEDGGRTFSLGTPSGEAWPESLERDSLEGWAWLRKRLANGWQADVLLGWCQRRGTWEGPTTIDPADLDREYLADILSPEALEASWGPLPDDRQWHLEVGGSWFFAAGPSLGGRLSYRSGAPVSPMGGLADGLGLDRRFVEERGSAGRSPELWRLDLIGSWPFEVGGGHLEVYAEISNLLGSQTAVELDQRWTVLDQVQAEGLDSNAQRTNGTWRMPLVVQRPMDLVFGVAYAW